MGEKNLKTFLKIRLTFKYIALLFLTIIAYRILFVHLLETQWPWLFVIAMFFLPIFCYLLQRKLILETEGKLGHWRLFFYSLIMIWVTAIGVASVLTLASILKQVWFFSNDVNSISPELSFIGTLYTHFISYTVFGIPSAIIVRLILLFKKN